MKFKLDEMDSNGILMVFTEVCSVCMCILAISKAGFGTINQSTNQPMFLSLSLVSLFTYIHVHMHVYHKYI